MRSLLMNVKGQSIVEITLMTPLILVALYVPFDFGMTIFTGHITQIAVRDGARMAATTDEMDDSKADTVAAQVYNNLPQLLVSDASVSPKQVTVRYYDTGGGADCARNVEVVAQGTYNFFLYRLIALLGFTPPDPIQINRATRMRYEHQPDYYGGQTGSTTNFCTTSVISGTYPSVS